MSARTCAVEVCGRAVACRGWCQHHYYRWRTYGEPGDQLAPADRVWPDRSRLRDRLIAEGVDRTYADLLAVTSQYEDRTDVRAMVNRLLGVE